MIIATPYLRGFQSGEGPSGDGATELGFLKEVSIQQRGKIFGSPGRRHQKLHADLANSTRMSCWETQAVGISVVFSAKTPAVKCDFQDSPRNTGL